MGTHSYSTFPKCTSSNTTSLGWWIPQNLVTNARAVMRTRTILYSRSDPEAAAALEALTSLSSSTSELLALALSLLFLLGAPTFLWRIVPCVVGVAMASDDRKIVRPGLDVG